MIHMRTTLIIDDAPLDRARQLTGIIEKTSLVRAGLEALIAREAGRRLAALGGTPFVLGKLACGNLNNRTVIFDSLARHLLASALLSNCIFWTLDERLGPPGITLFSRIKTLSVLDR